MAVTTAHAQLIKYTDSGNQIIVNLKTTGSDVSVDRSGNGNLPSGATTVQGLANSLGALAFRSSLSKSDVGLGNVDNTADANKNVNYANTAGTAGYALNLNSVTPILSTGIESSAITIKSNDNGALDGSFLSLRNAIDFAWYSSHWQIGNLRSASTPSAGFGFAFSDDRGETFTLKSFIDLDGLYHGRVTEANHVMNMDFLKIQKNTPTQECLWCKID